MGAYRLSITNFVTPMIPTSSIPDVFAIFIVIWGGHRF